MNIYPRESVEFQPVPIYKDGILKVTDIEYSIVGENERPGVYAAAATLAGATGFLVGTYTEGTYRVWARITDSPETPVLDCGIFGIS